MSVLATKLLELMRLADGGMGALTEHLLREVARHLVDDETAAPHATVID
jgi:hypothetical protein